MERRFERRRRQILEETHVRPAGVRERLNRRERFAEPFVASLRRRELKEHAQVYLSGLLSDLDRKNTESIAYRHDQDRQGLQRFIGWAEWDPGPRVDELVRQVSWELGEAEGVIIFDPSGHKKCGNDSVGVARQWLGRWGKVDNGQVGVYMGYASRREHALVDVRLYFPKEWAKDKVRRKKCGVPRAVRYRTRHELALEMRETTGGNLPHAGIAGDDEMGRSSHFRRELRGRGERYLLAVPSNTGIRDLDATAPSYGGRGRRPQVPFRRVDLGCRSRPAKAWRRIDVRDGEKGPLMMEIVTTRVRARTERSSRDPTDELLVVTRSREENGTMKYDDHLSNAPPDPSLEELARVVKAAHRVEDAIKRAKSEAGLSDYEGRTWAGWHHHQILSLIAVWFLIRETPRGKKIHPGPDGSTNSYLAGGSVASGLRPHVSWLGPTVHETPEPPPGIGPVPSLQTA